MLAEDNSQLDSFLEAAGQDIDFSPGGVSAPFPTAPVGVGATWVVTVLIAQDLVGIEQRTTHELLSIDGSLIELAISVDQTLLNTEALGVGLDNAETSYVATGSGTLMFDLSTPFPAASSLFLDQLIEISGESDGQSVSLITSNVVGVEFVTLEVIRR